MMPDDVFKFVNVRPVQKARSPRLRFAAYGEGRSPLHEKIVALPPETAREQSVVLADEFMKSADYLADRDPVIDEAARAASKESTVAKAKQAAAAALGSDIAAWLAKPATQTLKDRTWDSLYAQAITPDARPGDRDAIYANARGLHLIESLATLPDGVFSLDAQAFAAMGVTIPPDLMKRAGIKPVDEQRAERVKELKQRATEVLDQVRKLQGAAGELTDAERRFSGERAREISMNPGGATDVLLLGQLKPLMGPSFLIRNIAAPAQGQGGDQGLELGVIPPRHLLADKAFVDGLLSQGTRELMADRGALTAGAGVASAAESLRGEAHQAARAFFGSTPSGLLAEIAGDPAIRELADRVPLPFGPAIPRPSLAPPSPSPGASTPEARGVRPLGVGDLHVVKQKLLGYGPGELAHVENVMKSERRNREHKRSRETEETVTVEVEELEETEKSLQTTERFELRREAQKTVDTMMKLDAGVAVSATYGVVTVNAHADFALSNSVSESTRVASAFAREVTEKSISRIQQRTREERTRRTLERFEETNQHGFDNAAGTEHVVGFYRWINKYYRARVVNYGRRLMIEFIVPEPSAFYLHVTGNRTNAVNALGLTRPQPPRIHGRPLTPDDLDQWNVGDFIAAYGAQDVEAYPELERRVGAALIGKRQDGAADNSTMAESTEKLVVPTGYEAFDVYGSYSLGGVNKKWLIVEIAGQEWGSVTAEGLEGAIPVSVIGWCSSFQVNVVAQCRPTEETLAKWRLKAYQAIMSAYERALAAYNEKLAAATVQMGVAIEGRNPDLNRKIERDELRKAAIRLLTDDFASIGVAGQIQTNFQFRAMRDAGSGAMYPEFNPGRAMLEGQVIQFFEQAFEWNNIVYRFYPYFWAREEKWDDLYALTDPDPMFTDFLRAGSARMVAPVHPSYTQAVLYYLKTGVIWNGGEPPTIDDPMFISIVEEMKSDASVNDDADKLKTCSIDARTPCVVDEWIVKLPTTLVLLQRDESKLPQFDPD